MILSPDKVEKIGAGGVAEELGNEGIAAALIESIFAVFAAGRAKLPEQALRQNSQHGGVNKERLTAHIDQTGDGGAGSVIGMQGGEHEVAGQRRLQRQPRRFTVPDLPQP